MDQEKKIAQYQSEIISSCVAFLKEASELANRQFDSSDLPSSTVVVQIMEPCGQGSYSGKTLEFEEVNLPHILHALEKDLEASNSWNIANKAIRGYIEENCIKPECVFLHDVGNHYLWPLRG